MHEREPQPDLAAARFIARLLGPVLALLLLGAWALAWVRPDHDRQRFLAMQEAGQVELPPPPPPDKDPGIDNRILDPRDRKDQTGPAKPPQGQGPGQGMGPGQGRGGPPPPGSFPPPPPRPQ